MTVEKTYDNSGTIRWRENGELHREDGPAIVYPDGLRIWYRHGKRHRVDGPAFDDPRGRKEWWVDGEHHRDGAPATIAGDGTEVWYSHGKRHRADGPAVIYPGARPEEWWINDVRLEPRQVKELKAAFALKAVIAPFRGTIRDVTAPEKASFRNQKRPRVGAASLTH